MPPNTQQDNDRYAPVLSGEVHDALPPAPRGRPGVDDHRARSATPRNLQVAEELQTLVRSAGPSRDHRRPGRPGPCGAG
ncbi:hypothetical protein NKH18_10930 [Streptomyces sp. M10(2022)]